MYDYNAIKWEDWVYYDETSPTFLRWKVERRAGKHGNVLLKAVGDIAGYISSNSNYSKTSLFGRQYRNSRIIWYLFCGEIDPELHIDHIDGNIGNNKIENLRLVSAAVNSRNRNCTVKCSTTGVIGVNLTKNGSYLYYTAYWNNMNGEFERKHFSITKLGESEALRLACNHRQHMIDELNAVGAGYTARHGTQRSVT